MLVRCDRRHALFLQGTGSQFFSRLSTRLEDVGITTSKIHLCVGDHLFWTGQRKVNYRGSFNGWQNYLADYILQNAITDIVLFSDSRPYHAVAVKVAKHLKVNVFVFENGYLRPNWITMEQGGVNGRSRFPDQRRQIEALAQSRGQSAIEIGAGSLPTPKRLYFGDTVFHAVNFLTAFTFPGYGSFRNVSALAEAKGWIKKALMRYTKVRRATSVLEKLLASDKPFFFFPLQLDHDYQLKIDSPFATIHQACSEIISSFAKHAPPDARLLIKNHPLDNNLINRQAAAKRLARRFGVEEQVVFIESGHNPTILKKAKGMVTINSTMGTSALQYGLPMCVLGDAVYNIDGLAHRGGLTSFWTSPQPVDRKLARDFRTALVNHCQIEGHFSEKNINAAVYNMCISNILATSYQSPIGICSSVMEIGDKHTGKNRISHGKKAMQAG